MSVQEKRCVDCLNRQSHFFVCVELLLKLLCKLSVFSCCWTIKWCPFPFLGKLDWL